MVTKSISLGRGVHCPSVILVITAHIIKAIHSFNKPFDAVVYSDFRSATGPLRLRATLICSNILINHSLIFTVALALTQIVTVMFLR